MKLKLRLTKDEGHTDLVGAVLWSGADEVLSAGDDHSILKWNSASDAGAKPLAKLAEDVFPTDMQWYSQLAGGGVGAGSGAGGGAASNKKPSASDIFVCTSTDGKFMFISRNGRIEKTVDAHRGAILSARWSPSGNDLLTSGEDGHVKIWSASGMLRSSLAQNTTPVYSIAWGPESDRVLYTNGHQLVIKPLQSNAKVNTWKAHDGLVLKVDWSVVNQTIVSCGEDCRYKVWDSFGRQVYTSSAFDYPLTSVSWSLDGELFAVGSFNTLQLCDANGWSHTLEKPNSGSLYNIAWSSDGTQLAAACGGGQVLLAYILERRLEWKNYEVLLTNRKHVSVRNVTNDATDELEFRDRVVKMSIGFGHLVVTTMAQCYVYSEKNWNTPTIFDLRDASVRLISQCNKHFLLIDRHNIFAYSYEGRLVCTPRVQGMKTSTLCSRTIAICDDTVAILDKTNPKLVHLFELNTGKVLGDGKPFQHTADISEISLNQTGSGLDRHMSFIDNNSDLYITQVRVVGADRKTKKLSSMVHSMAWNDAYNMLAALVDASFNVWMYPNAAYVDKDLVSKTVYSREASEFGKNPTVINFHDTSVNIRRSEGSLSTCGISIYPSVLHRHMVAKKWTEAVRLCRFAKDEILWSCLAAMSAFAKEFETAEIAYAAIDQCAKVHFLQKIKRLPSRVVRSAEMLMFCGKHRDAEGALLQAGMTFRAIMLNLDLYNWNRALELALKHKSHVDTVLAFRKRYLEKFEKQETNKKYLQYTEGVDTDWEKIKVKMQMEYENEKKD